MQSTPGQASKRRIVINTRVAIGRPVVALYVRGSWGWLSWRPRRASRASRPLEAPVGTKMPHHPGRHHPLCAQARAQKKKRDRWREPTTPGGALPSPVGPTAVPLCTTISVPWMAAWDRGPLAGLCPVLPASFAPPPSLPPLLHLPSGEMDRHGR